MENRPLKDLSVPGLKRRGITLTNTTKSNLDGTHILKDPSNPGAARISYRPRLESLQHLLKSNHALQFSVKYDVDRQSDKAGEIQAQYIYLDSELLLSNITCCTQGDLTQIFATIPNPMVNLNFYMKTDPGLAWVSKDKLNSVEFPTICRIATMPLLPQNDYFCLLKWPFWN